MQRKLSDYGTQLREKQKMRRIYGVLERQFRNYMKEATRRQGVTGDTLLMLLECRLDNIVYRLSLASSRAQARQFVNHGHILVNGKRVDIPSYQVKAGDVITVKDDSKKRAPMAEAVKSSAGRTLPAWLGFDAEAFKGEVLAMPKRDEIDTDVQESLIVEYYSR